MGPAAVIVVSDPKITVTWVSDDWASGTWELQGSRQQVGHLSSDIQRGGPKQPRIGWRLKFVVYDNLQQPFRAWYASFDTFWGLVQKKNSEFWGDIGISHGQSKEVVEKYLCSDRLHEIISLSRSLIGWVMQFLGVLWSYKNQYFRLRKLIYTL